MNRQAVSDRHIEAPDWLRPIERILEELNEGVVIADDRLRVVFANEALLRLAMATREQLQGVTPEAVFPPKDIPDLLRQHDSGHRYGRYRTEFYLPTKNGNKIPAIFSGRVIRGPDGEEYVLLIGLTSVLRSGSRNNFGTPTRSCKNAKRKSRQNCRLLLGSRNRSHRTISFGMISR